MIAKNDERGRTENCPPRFLVCGKQDRVSVAAASAVLEARDFSVLPKEEQNAEKNGDGATAENVFDSLIAASENEHKNENPKAGIASERVKTVHISFLLNGRKGSM